MPAAEPERRTPSVSEVTIACAFDDAFVPHFATCATSIAASRGSERVHFILLAGPTLSSRTSEAACEYVRDLGLYAEVVSPTDDALRSLPEDRFYFSPLVWYRLLLPTLLPHHDRILSLDADTLVLQSLAPLFERDLGDNLLAAVAQPPGRFSRHWRDVVGLNASQRYFNAGVLLLNLKAMRESDAASRAVALGHAKGEALTFAEQDALNHVAQDRWELLHPKWNALSYLWVMPNIADDAYTTLERETARTSPAVVHFEGGQVSKPWYYRSCHPLRELYREYRAQTPWPLERLENPSVLGAGLRRLPVTWQDAITYYKAAATGRIARRR